MATSDIYRNHVLASDDPLVQVGHTLGGKPIAASQLNAMILQVHAALDLGSDDVLLDIGCGNGYITSRLAKKAGSVIGIDLSPDLIDVAQRSHCAGNIDYVELDARNVGALGLDRAQRFSKVVALSALQHLGARDLARVLDGLMPMLADEAILFFGYIPDKRKKWRFYNTPRRALAHVWRTLVFSECLAHWWRYEHLSSICAKRGLVCTYQEAPSDFAAYRFNVRIEAKR